MNTPFKKALLALQLLLEGNSIRSAERITGLDKNTIKGALVYNLGSPWRLVLPKRINNVADQFATAVGEDREQAG